MHATKNLLKDIETITKRDDFVRANKAGRKWISKSVIVQVVDNALKNSRLGFTVTKKTEKSAVKRNRIKRRLRAAAADTLSRHAKPGLDYIFIGRSETSQKPYAILCKDLKWCLKKLEVLES